MKTNLVLAAAAIAFVLASGSQASAIVAKPKPKPSNAKIDCSEADKGIVKLSVAIGEIDLPHAAKLAYERCLQTGFAEIAKARETAKDKSRADFDEQHLCGVSLPTQTVLMDSWMSERMDSDGNSGGEATVMVREPISCSGIGTGLFAGVNAAVAYSLHVDSTVHMDQQTEKQSQSIEVTVEGASSVLVKSKHEAK